MSCKSIWKPLTANVLVVAAAAALASAALADGPAVTRIEEDWELVISAPSPTADAPQVTCLISPLGDASSFHATFVVNHHEAPQFAAGGLQLQVWNGDALLVSKRSPNQAVLATPGETIRWTQVMRLAPEGLVFEIRGGTSTTWGNFGNDESLTAAIATAPQNLNAYSLAVSAQNSGVSFAANRVQSLVLKRVRAYAGEQLLGEVTNPRVVHSLDQ